MKLNFSNVRTAFLWILFLTVSSAFGQNAPTPMRDRIAPQPTVTPTPKVSPSPKTSTTPKISPTPAPQSLSDLTAKIRRTLQNSALARGQVGVKIVSLDSGKTIFEENGEKFFMPASNMKSFTVAAALDRLTPNFRFVTSVHAVSKPEPDGTLRGDLLIYGRGDPTFAASLNDGDYYRAVNALADKIIAAGIKKIEGNLVGDESYFSGDARGSSWEWDDLQWYYGAEISALTINDNAVDVSVKPASSVGAPLFVLILPANSMFSIVNLTTTAPAGSKRNLKIEKRLGANVLEISGTMAIGDSTYNGAIAVTKPAEMFVAQLKTALQQKNVVVTGQTRTINKPTTTLPPEIARHESAPFSFVAAKTMKPSQNLYTELILRALGEQSGDKSNSNKTSVERGLEVAEKFRAEAGIAPGSVVQWDGSGLSRHNLITPNAAAQLYVYMHNHRFANVWRESLTIGGVDGTLRGRFQNSPAQGNVRGKTGTIDQVGTIAGYVTTASGEKLAFAILTNNLPDGTVRRQTMDEIVLALANFNGK